jgi:hexosaminidase
MPAPAAIQFQVGRLPITIGFAIAASKYSDDRLQRAIDRTTHRLGARTGIEFVRPTGAAEHSALLIEVQRSGDLVQSLNEVESYTLQVTSQQGLLKAETVVGALRGLETLLQLVSADRDGYFWPAVSIQDQPRFRWRGLLIDVCRHWQPIEVIKRNLDGMAAVKLNVLHWHLTDDQGFRIESKKYPRLSRMGSDSYYYSQIQVREIVAYARDRGIRIIPEFDMPGHATGWLAGYPELASAPGPYSIEHAFGVFDPTLDPTREATYKFLDGFLGEMAALFPDAYVHIGGDENNGKHWKANSLMQSFMKAHNIKDESSLQAYFNQRVQKILERHGKKMVIWEEPMPSPQGVVLESWHSGTTLREAVQHGHEALLSAPYYLDQIEPASELYKTDPLPPDSGLTPEQMKLALGGEACMWTEHVSTETIDSRIWPFLAAVAERFWSPRDTSDIADMYRRLDIMRVRLEEFGLKHISHTDAMLRLEAQGPDVGILHEFIQTLQPATFDQRETLQRPAQFTPLSHMLDAANPDPPYGRILSSSVDALLSDAPRFVANRADLEVTFHRWSEMPGAWRKSRLC